MDYVLDAVAVRVLGALIEKESTTPDNYPLTMNSLVAACNQTTNREPVMTLDEATVAAAVDELIRKSLVRAVHRSDSRARRYRQTLSETLHLHAPETAVLCVLLLRGSQTVGELRTRTARMHEFPSLEHVEVTLKSLMDLSPPLVAELPRRPGQKEIRYAHLLSGEPVAEAVHVATEDYSPPPGRLEVLEESVAALRAELAELRAQFERFRAQF
jgi:uncharacterized protein YceH (UPF0502 family)